jgi:hypothetical protein
MRLDGVGGLFERCERFRLDLFQGSGIPLLVG